MISKVKKYTRLLAKYAMPGGPRVGYIGGVHGSRNLGDEALSRAAQKLFPKCSLIDFPRKMHIARIAKRVLRVNNALLAGGTLINQQRIWLDLVSNYIPQIPRFMVFGTGVGHPLFWNDSRSEWRTLLNLCCFVGVRGPLSAELLVDANVNRVEVIGDPVLVFASDKLEQSNIHVSGSIGLNIGWDKVNQFGTEDQIYTEAIKLAILARNAGWTVTWFVICPSDFDLTYRLALNSGTASNIKCVYDDPVEYISLVSSCSVFVGTRLHSVVLATCAYVPSLMLEYRPKCRDYMLSIKQSEFIIRTDKFLAEETWEKVRYLNSRRRYFSKALYYSIKPLHERQKHKAHKLQTEMLHD